MAAILQNLLAIGLVAACGTWAGWQGFKSLSGKRSKVGNCCAKGCGSAASAAPPQQDRVQFLPSDLLRDRVKRNAAEKQNRS